MTRLPLIPLVALLVYGGLYGLWLTGHTPAYFTILKGWGIEPFRFPFLDLDAVLAARQCAARGVDVFVVNPCDILGRVHIYSPLWLVGATGTEPALSSVGITTDLAFLLALALLPAPQHWTEILATLVATLSTMVVYALERANNDLVIFVILVASARVLAGKPGWSRLAYAGYLLGALLKFYPLVLVAATLRERRPVALAVLLLFAAVIGTFVAIYRTQLTVLFTHFPHGSPFADLFGASNIGTGLGRLLGAGPMVSVSATIAMGLYCLRISVRSYRSPLARAACDLDAARRHLLVAGLLIVIGCFFAGQSVGYRGIDFLMILPGLLGLGENTDDDAARRLALRTIALILALMWEEPVRLAVTEISRSTESHGGYFISAGFWILREVAWWTLIGIFAGILARLLRPACMAAAR